MEVSKDGSGSVGASSAALEAEAVGRAVAGGEAAIVGRSIPDGWCGYDIGPESAALFAAAVAGAGTVLWNGPMGVFEDARFAAGTRTVASAVAACPGRTVVGGGDSVAALNRMGLSEQIDHISTGGGASLEFLERGDLPGLRALRESRGRVAARSAG